MDLLALAVKAVIGAATKPAVEKARRQEAVARVLHHLKLTPKNPPSDFEGVYVYTLVQYCYGKPAPVAMFFRNEYIRDAFRDSFDTGDPTHLDREAEKVIAWNDVTNKLGPAGYNFRREFAGFTYVFNTLVDRTRSTVQARQERKLDSLGDQLLEIHEQLMKFGSLEELRTLAIASERVVLDTSLTRLAEDLKSWFEAVGYTMERDEGFKGDGYRCVINVPSRRRFDRVLVHAVAGGAQVSDVVALAGHVKNAKADEGWLVAPRRVSLAARNAADNSGGSLYTYTLDELVDEDVNFEPYLDWLDSEVRNRGIDKNYVDLYCRKDEYDPQSNQAIGSSIYDGRNGGLEGYVKAWLSDSSKEHLSILGEFGMGKSWFCLYFAQRLAREYREAARQGLPRPRLPIVVSLRDYAKAVTVESLFSEFFFRKHDIKLDSYAVFEELNRAGRLLLIFDGFDEMAARIDRQAMVNNFWELARVVVPNAKVMLTCRNEHFPDATEGRKILSAQLKASTSALSGEPPQFEVVELLKFENEQVKKMLRNLTDEATVEKITTHPELLDLMRRPVMSELVLDALPDIAAGAPTNLARVYFYAVRRKMSRDITAERTFTSTTDKLYFLCELSWEMLSTSSLSLNYREFPERIRTFFGDKVREEKSLDHWHRDMTSQTMLIRNNDGDYSPAHRSLLEFFVAYKFAAELGCLAPDFIALLKDEHVGHTQAAGSDITWSSYFRDRYVEPQEIVSLNCFAPESLDNLTKTFGLQMLPPALTELMLPLLEQGKTEDILWRIIEETKGRTAREVEVVGGNSATLLVALNPSYLKGRNLQRANLQRAQLSQPDRSAIREVDLSDSNLREADLSFTVFENTRLENCDLRGAIFDECTGLGRNKHYPITLLPSESGQSAFVCVGDGRLLEWSLTDGGDTLRQLATVDSSWLEIELFGDDRFAGLTRRSTVIIERDNGSVLQEWTKNPGYAPIFLPSLSFILIMVPQTPLVSHLESKRAYVLDSSTFEIVEEVSDLPDWGLGYFSSSYGRTLFLERGTGKVLTIEGVNPLTWISRGDLPYKKLDMSQFGTEICFATEKLWIREVETGKVAMMDLSGQVLWYSDEQRPRQSELSPVAVDPNQFGRWAMLSSDESTVVLTNGSLISAWSTTSPSRMLWKDDLVVSATDLRAMPSGEYFIVGSRSGELQLRRVFDGSIVATTSTSTAYRGAIFDSTLDPVSVRGLIAGGACFVAE